MYKDLPLFVSDYLNYLKSIKGLAKSTIHEYYYDLNNFIKYIEYRRHSSDYDIDNIENIDITNFTVKDFSKIDLKDLHAYLSYIDNELNDSPTTRARKISSIKSLYNYLVKITNDLKINVADQLERPKIKKRNPVYLTLSECYTLLETAKNTQKNEFLQKRDLAIIVTFLTTGVRLSELVSIDVDSIKDDSLSVVGKGNKERVVYITETCKSFIENYLLVRPKIKNQNALFLSTRDNRISNRAVQHMIEKYLLASGFDTSIYSVHKLRHTAATLMYKEGVDIRTLQKVLGHSSVATTQIYTHIEDEDVRHAVDKNPIKLENLSN